MDPRVHLRPNCNDLRAPVFLSGDFVDWGLRRYRPDLIDDLLMVISPFVSDQASVTDSCQRLTWSIFTHRYPDTGFARSHITCDGLKAEFSKKSLV